MFCTYDRAGNIAVYAIAETFRNQSRVDLVATYYSYDAFRKSPYAAVAFRNVQVFGGWIAAL